jgi:hypothetical protein
MLIHILTGLARMPAVQNSVSMAVFFFFFFFFFLPLASSLSFICLFELLSISLTYLAYTANYILDERSLHLECFDFYFKTKLQQKLASLPLKTTIDSNEFQRFLI